MPNTEKGIEIATKTIKKMKDATMIKGTRSPKFMKKGHMMTSDGVMRTKKK